MPKRETYNIHEAIKQGHFAKLANTGAPCPEGDDCPYCDPPLRSGNCEVCEDPHCAGSPGSCYEKLA